MNLGNGYRLFPVYTFSADHDHQSACTGACAEFWPPLLTDDRPQASNGVDRDQLGVLRRPDGTRQVTFAGQPLYLFVQDAGAPGVATGAGVNAFGGTFQMVSPD
jgi:predicted lipoprotein with Yx(FWY)xxD motif